MKTLLKTCAALLLASSLTGFAADEKMPKSDHIMMQDGKMMVMKGGETMMMDKEMTLNNGTKVMTDGSVMMKDGKKAMMKDGDSITMDGKMMKSPMEKK